MGEKSVQIRRLALDIAGCSEIKTAAINASHPCHDVASKSRQGDSRQLPEAWVGNLGTARLMILSSNPTISEHADPRKQELFPLGTWDMRGEHPEWPLDRVADFQTNRFDQNREKAYVLPDTRFLTTSGEYVSKTNKYWLQSFRIGKEIFQNSFSMEQDILLTEVVHCKSKGEFGVPQAVSTCGNLYLNRILNLSPARIIVIAGAQARGRIVEMRAAGEKQWDISDSFGRLPKSAVELAHLNRVGRQAHVGILRMADRNIPIVALQQLSMASNPCRSLTSLLGSTAVNRLAEIVTQQEPFDFGAMSRTQFAEWLTA